MMDYDYDSDGNPVESQDGTITALKEAVIFFLMAAVIFLIWWFK